MAFLQRKKLDEPVASAAQGNGDDPKGSVKASVHVHRNDDGSVSSHFVGEELPSSSSPHLDELLKKLTEDGVVKD